MSSPLNVVQLSEKEKKKLITEEKFLIGKTNIARSIYFMYQHPYRVIRRGERPPVAQTTKRRRKVYSKGEREK
jgi:hypothetical protein